MRDPQRKTENTWLTRLMRAFQADKTQDLKKETAVTRVTYEKRAFVISIIFGIAELLSAVVFMVAGNGQPVTISDIRVLCALLSLACFISAWLARKGKATVGAMVILAVVYLASLLVAMSLSDAGLLLGTFDIGITLALTSAVMPIHSARRVNVIGLFFAAIPVVLDVFQPFPRPLNPYSTIATFLALVFLLVFAFVIVRQFNTYNLRTKLIIAFAAVTVLPLIAIGYYDNLKLSDTLYQNSRDTLSQFADQTAFQVDTFIEHQLTSIDIQSRNPLFVQFLALGPTQRTNTPEERIAQKALVILAGEDKTFIRGYRLLDNTGIVVLSTDAQQGQDESQTPFFKDSIAKNQAVVNGPLIDQKSGKASLYFSAPVKDETGKKLGVLVAEYNANVIETTVEQLIPSNNTNGISFHVVDAENFVRIANTDDTKLLYKSYQNFSPEQVAALQKQGFLLPGSVEDALAVASETLTGLKNLAQSAFFTTLDDKTLQVKDLNSAAKMKSVPWLVMVRQSETAVLTPLAQQKRITASIFIALLILITLAAFGLSQLLASPILKLAATAQKIAAGDLSLQSDIESNDEIGALASSFNEMTRQTRALINSLEQRSKALATSSEVSRRISTLLDQQELVTEVVKQVQSAFNYYHAHIYILDENTQELVMAGGTGEAGKAMLARGHKIAMGKGLVGRAAQNNITVLVADVAQEPQWLPNPLLPETKSEVAVPIAIADRVLGVLDVQHNADTLKQEDVDVLQSIANQVAFAVRNARSYSEVQAKADRESLITSISQKIQSTITVESAMQVAIREIGRALNGAKTQIVLNENANENPGKNQEYPITQSKS